MIRYSLRQLAYFTTCVEAGSFAAAAERLHVSQPSISTAIAKLEAELGVQLLLRHHAQGVSPTAAAEPLLHAARSLLDQAEDFQRLAQSSAEQVSGELRLGGFVTLAPAMLPGMLAELRVSYPDLSVRLGEGAQDQLIAGLRDGRYEMALLYDLDLPEDLRTSPVAELEPYMLLPADHALARDKAVDLRALAGEPFILLDVPPSREYFTQILRDAGVTPKIAYSSPSLELVRGLVGRGLGVSLLATRPEGDLTYDGQRLAVRPVLGETAPSRIVLASLRALRPTRAMTAFQELAPAAARKSP